MDGGEPVCHLLQQRKRLPEREPPGAVEPLSERLSVEELHRDKGYRSPVRPRSLVEVEDPADVRVGHGTGELDLAPEPLEERVAVGRRLADCLQRDRRVEPEIPRLVDLSHSTAAHESDELEALEEELALSKPRGGRRSALAGHGLAQSLGLVLELLHGARSPEGRGVRG